ncbi:NADP-dependent oxidoreductase [Chitinophaga polysaccharea]|uniref:NADP-dependent oxidoreductase n=1 Tax=Chitinophaga polysaccharea TaxID=1293035 RepID=UPI00115781E8|nr:NADP-dependent oxidoreductase [Chitinophaga polysaccharea]
MKAVVLKGAGSVDNLVLTELPVPEPAETEVLVKIKAISINPVDVKTRAGKGRYNILKEENPLILGWDISGVVVASNSPLFKENDEVFGMVNFPGHGRAYAEYVAAPAAHLALKPANISHEEAAAATLAALTAWQALVDHASIKPGHRVLIHAAAGGVGHYAVQLAKNLGAYVIGTSSAANRDVILGLGADEHIDYHTQPLVQHVSDVDFVLDTIGGDVIDQSLEVMKPGATIISIPSGLREAVTVKAEAKGINGFFILVASNGAEMGSIAVLLEQGRLRSIVSKTFPLEEIQQAHLQVETGRTVGKVIVRV